MDCAAIVGLGNPGRRYAATRHNAGFFVLQELFRRWEVSPKEGKGPYLIAAVKPGGRDREALLIAPTTFMNNSGDAVRDVVERYEVPASSLLVVLDDFWLPLGKIRFRHNGSDGGHNGLASIIAALETDAIPRLRLGIGREEMPPKAMMADFVLSEFLEDERAIVADMVIRAANAAEEFTFTGTISPRNPKAENNSSPEIS